MPFAVADVRDRLKDQLPATSGCKLPQGRAAFSRGFCVSKGGLLGQAVSQVTGRKKPKGTVKRGKYRQGGGMICQNMLMGLTAGIVNILLPSGCVNTQTVRCVAGRGDKCPGSFLHQDCTLRSDPAIDEHPCLF